MLHVSSSPSAVRVCARQDATPRSATPKQPKPAKVPVPPKSPWPASKSKYLANRWLESVDANLQQRPVVGQVQRAATPLVALLLAPIDALSDAASLLNTKAE